MQSIYEDSMKRLDEIFKDDIKQGIDDNGNEVLTFSGISISLDELHQRTTEEMNEKMGYELTGKTRVINDNLTLVHYCK